MKEVIDEFPDDLDDDEKERTAENENEGVIHRDITKNETGTNWDTTKMVIEELPDDQDDDEKEKQHRIKTKV